MTLESRVAKLEASVAQIPSADLDAALLREAARLEASTLELVFRDSRDIRVEAGRLIWPTPPSTRDRDVAATICRILADDTQAQADSDAVMIRTLFGHATDLAMHADKKAHDVVWTRTHELFGDELYRTGNAPGGRYAGRRADAPEESFSCPFIRPKRWGPPDSTIGARRCAEIEATFAHLFPKETDDEP